MEEPRVGLRVVDVQEQRLVVELDDEIFDLVLVLVKPRVCGFEIRKKVDIGGVVFGDLEGKNAEMRDLRRLLVVPLKCKTNLTVTDHFLWRRVSEMGVREQQSLRWGIQHDRPLGPRHRFILQ
jgi:hypothetical protein